MIVQYPLVVIALVLWIGFVGAISFMEAWLKFRAPGITLPLGLGIGRIVFRALNKMEWLFAIIICGQFIYYKQSIFQLTMLPYLFLLLILILQTFWLLPNLDKRAELHIKGESVPRSNLHFYYVGLEIIKIVCLTWLTFTQFKTITP